MDPRILPFIKFSEDDTSQEAPQIRLEMKLYHAESQVSSTSPIRILIKLRREQDNLDSHCIFVWNNFEAFANTKFVLICQTEDNFEQVHIEKQEIKQQRSHSEDKIMKVNGWNHDLEQLGPGSSTPPRLNTLLTNYHKALISGQKYRLIWPGGEVLMWDWGSKKGFVGKELLSQEVRESKLPRLIVPACAGIEFTAMDEEQPWPDRAEYESKLGFSGANHKEAEWRREQNPPPSPPPIAPSQRVPEAPILNLTLEIDRSQMTRNGDFAVTSRVTLDRPIDVSLDVKPITFHIYDFYNAYRVYRFREGKWKRCETEDTMCTGFILVDDPDDKVKVKEHKDFLSLRPGESWEAQKTIQDAKWTWIPDDSVVGDKFRFVFKGTTLDWWNWGDREDHAETVVELPRYPARVQKPSDNDGRPKLVVPESNTVEFSIVDG